MGSVLAALYSAVVYVLFLGTFVLNLISAWLRARFREEYS